MDSLKLRHIDLRGFRTKERETEQTEQSIINERLPESIFENVKKFSIFFAFMHKMQNLERYWRLIESILPLCPQLD